MVKIFLFRNCVFVSQATSLRILLSYRLNQRNVSQEKKQVLLPIHDSFILLSSCINLILPKFHFILTNPIYWMLKISIFLIFIVTNCMYRITCKTWRKIQNTTYIEKFIFLVLIGTIPRYYAFLRNVRFASWKPVTFTIVIKMVLRAIKYTYFVFMCKSHHVVKHHWRHIFLGLILIGNYNEKQMIDYIWRLFDIKYIQERKSQYCYPCLSRSQYYLQKCNW